MEAIFEDMKPGMFAESCVIFEPDRREAMALALKEARRDGIVLIAGKDHQTYQQIGDENSVLAMWM
ncbi:MAG: hypothetical protein LBR92_01830 [Puniceicoccales bacterium]|jgi:UDP-N-acetylmuramoyl-L-alanyl-D-glutamate--2,6-diaminopimelate ligase|nr:hypothetical protein [Puniceicoccales bacterium]